MSEYKKTTPEVSGEFHTVDRAGYQEIWKARGSNDNGGYLAVQHVSDAERVRRFERSDDGWRCVDDPDEFTDIIHKLAAPYIPQIGHRVIMGHEESGLWGVETIEEISPDGAWLVVSHQDFGGQDATANADGEWFLAESGQQVFLLDPQARPERGSTGFVFFDEGSAEVWSMDGEHDTGYAEGFLHTEQYVGIAHIQPDGTWMMNDTDQIFFLSSAQSARWHNNPNQG